MNIFLRFLVLIAGILLTCPKWHLMGVPFWPDLICFVAGAGLICYAMFFWPKR